MSGQLSNILANKDKNAIENAGFTYVNDANGKPVLVPDYLANEMSGSKNANASTPTQHQNTPESPNNVASSAQRNVESNQRVLNYSIGQNINGDITGYVVQPTSVHAQSNFGVSYIVTDWLVELALLILSSKGVNINALPLTQYADEVANVNQGHALRAAKVLSTLY